MTIPTQTNLLNGLLEVCLIKPAQIHANYQQAERNTTACLHAYNDTEVQTVLHMIHITYIITEYIYIQKQAWFYQ
jgi:hypothetical protein